MPFVYIDIKYIYIYIYICNNVIYVCGMSVDYTYIYNIYMKISVQFLHATHTHVDREIRRTRVRTNLRMTVAFYAKRAPPCLTIN